MRREPNGTRWAIIEAVSDRGVRRARTPDGWDMVYLLGGDELFAWPDAASAVAEAQRGLSELLKRAMKDGAAVRVTRL